MTAIIILAAGASARLGRPKQLLAYRGKMLLQHAVDEALDTSAASVIVVLGANAGAIRPAIADRAICIVENREWSNGMGTSIRAGVKSAMQLQPAIHNVLLMLCDQPLATRGFLQHMIEAKGDAGNCIAAAAYNSTLGAPVVFGSDYFESLMALPDDAGAKQLLQKYRSQVVPVPFAGGAVDVDTAQDYERLIASGK